MKERLPDNWVVTELASAVIYGKGKKPKTLSSAQKKGLVPYVDIKAFEKGIIDAYADVESSKIIDSNDVLVVWDGARFGLTGMGIEGAAGSTLMVLTPVLCEPRYLYCFINRYYSYINSKPKGSGTPHVNPDIFWKLPFPIAPLNEQKRIVARLDRIIPRIDELKTRLDNIPTIIKRFRQSVLTAAVLGRLTEKWREVHPEVEGAEELINKIRKSRKDKYSIKCKTAKEQGKRKPNDYDNYKVNLRTDFDLWELPESWAWVDFRFIMSEDEPFCYGVVQPGNECVDGNFLIRAGDIKNDTVDTSTLRTISKEIDEEYSRSKVHGGEVLVTVVGAGIGECGIVPSSCKNYNIARAVSKIPLKDISSKFTLNWLKSATANKWMKSEAREVARPTLNLEQLKTIPFPLPPLEEQKEIVRQVERLFSLADKLEAHYQNARARVDKLARSVLAKAFRGELAPQDPDDEPAEKLLERILAEKETMETAVKNTRIKDKNEKTKRFAAR